MLILLSLLLHYRLIYSCLLWKNIATTKHSVDTECVQCTSLSSQVMLPLVSKNDLVMVNIYTCFQTPYIRSIRKKVTFVSRLQITEITIELFFFFFVTSKNMLFFFTPQNMLGPDITTMGVWCNIPLFQKQNFPWKSISIWTADDPDQLESSKSDHSSPAECCHSKSL